MPTQLDFSFGGSISYILTANINNNSTINLHSFQPRLGVTNRYAVSPTEAATTIADTIERLRTTIQLYESFLHILHDKANQ
jgi:alpha/beta superfamily hydrolase